MVGRIVGGEPGGPAEASSIPDGSAPVGETIVREGSVGVDGVEGTEDGRGGRGGDGTGPGGGTRPGGPGWMLLVPVGFLSGLLGLVGGVVYRAGSRGRARADESRDTEGATERRDERSER